MPGALTRGRRPAIILRSVGRVGLYAARTSETAGAESGGRVGAGKLCEVSGADFFIGVHTIIIVAVDSLFVDDLLEEFHADGVAALPVEQEKLVVGCVRAQ